MAERNDHCKDVLGVLSAYIDGDLSARECDKLAAHLEGCDYCRELFLSMEATRDGVARLGENLTLKDGETAECIERCRKVISMRLKGKRSS